MVANVLIDFKGPNGNLCLLRSALAVYLGKKIKFSEEYFDEERNTAHDHGDSGNILVWRDKEYKVLLFPSSSD